MIGQRGVSLQVIQGQGDLIGENSIFKDACWDAASVHGRCTAQSGAMPDCPTRRGSSTTP